MSVWIVNAAGLTPLAPCPLPQAGEGASVAREM